MRIPRVLIRAELLPGQTVDLPRDQAHHLVKVLRLRDAHPIRLFDGAGREFEGRLQGTSRALVDGPVERAVESPLAVRLIQGISRGQKMDYALQKAVELGVTCLQPAFCERSVVRLDSKRLEKRMDHWQGVIESACAQSGRTRVPALEPAINLLELPIPAQGTGLYLDPEASQSLADVPRPGSVSLVIGPEGGLSPLECRHLAGQGFEAVQLGPRVLRTETASVAALTAVQLLWGDLSQSC